jgi:hypothetical protein
MRLAGNIFPTDAMMNMIQNEISPQTADMTFDTYPSWTFDSFGFIGFTYSSTIIAGNALRALETELVIKSSIIFGLQTV